MSSKKLNLTLVVCLVFVLTVSSFANADFVAARRTHRMAKKRSPDLGLVGVGEDPSTISATSQSSSATSSAPASVSSTSSSASSTPSSPASTSASASSASALLNSLSLSLSSSSSSSSTSSSSSSSSTSTSTSSSTTSTTSSSSTTSTSDSPPQTTPPSLVTELVSGEIVTLTATAASEQTSAAANQLSGAAQNNDNKTKSAALTTLIVVASCVGGVVILWTIFRKWKLARSSKFDQRLQPIDWQPTDAEDRDPAMLRRRASDSSSFHSGTSHAGYPGSGSDHGHGYGATTLPPLPDHDFTAGPSHLAPVGGYADLARGPSPSPQMNELARGPSFTRPNYDIGVPIHNQAAYRY